VKLTVQGQEYPVVSIGKWTFEEADEVRRLTNLRAGAVLSGLMLGDQNADLAFAVVAYIRAGKNPEELRALTLDELVFDPSDDLEEAEKESPPAEGADAGKSDGAL
jgi:hypothetical protein